MANDKIEIPVGGAGSSKTMTSPFYLHPSDHPGMMICAIQFRGDNYDEWSRAMKNSLRAKRKLGFIEGTIQQPKKEEPEYEDWCTVNSMLVGWIVSAIEPTIRSTIAYVENVKELWEDLRDRFSIGNGPRVQQLKAELARSQQGGQSVVTYYGKLKQLWDELVNYDPIPVCHCSGCSCNLTTTLTKRQEAERVHQFLMGLDDAIYGTVRSNILSMEPLPNLMRVYSMIIQEERHRSMARGRNERMEGAVAFAVQPSDPKKPPMTTMPRERSTMKCTSCGKIGHDVQSCFQLIGYPDWWEGSKSGGTVADRRAGRGTGGRAGGRSGSGRGRGTPQRAHAVHGSAAAGSEGVSEADRNGIPGLNNEQWNRLLNLLSAGKNSDDNVTGKPNFNE